MHFHGHISLSYSVDLEVTMPAHAPLTVHNRFGSVDVSGIHAASEIVNAQGSSTLRDSRGTQRVENSFGSITVENSAGDTTVQNANGSVRVVNVDGTLGDHQPLRIRDVNDTHNVTIRNANGSVELRDVAGNASIVDSFASVTVVERLRRSGSQQPERTRRRSRHQRPRVDQELVRARRSSSTSAAI